MDSFKDIGNMEFILLDIQKRLNQQTEFHGHLEKSLFSIEERFTIQLSQSMEQVMDKLQKLQHQNQCKCTQDPVKETQSLNTATVSQDIPFATSDLYQNNSFPHYDEKHYPKSSDKVDTLSQLSTQMMKQIDILQKGSIQKLEKENEMLLSEKEFMKTQLIDVIDDVARQLTYLQRSDVRVVGDVTEVGCVDDALCPLIDETWDHSTHISVDAFKELIDEVKVDRDKQMESNNIEIKRLIDLNKQEIKTDLLTMKSVISDLTADLCRNTCDIRDEIKRSVESSETKKEFMELCGKLSCDVQTIETQSKVINDRITVLRAEIMRELKSSTNDIRQTIISSETNIQNDLAHLKDMILRDIHIDTDRQLQLLGRDLSDIIEKESFLIKEKEQVPGNVLKNTYECYFRITNFEQRIKSEVSLWSCPWYISQLETCLKGYAHFDAEGNISIKITCGRHPRLVGVRPKSEKPFNCQVSLISETSPVKEKVFYDGKNLLLEETLQKHYGSWGYKLKSWLCEDLKNMDFVKSDTLLIKYVFTVPLPPTI